MSMAWIAVGTAVVGTATNLYGANKQAKAIEASNASNQEEQDKQNNSAWASFLLGKGVAPTTPVTAGVMPSAGNYTAVNTRLPLWASMNTPTGASRWQKVGTSTSPVPGTLAVTKFATAPTNTTLGYPAPASIGSSGNNVFKKIADPLGIFS